MPLTFAEIDGQPVAVVYTEEDYHEAVEVLGVPFIFVDDLLGAPWGAGARAWEAADAAAPQEISGRDQ